jgi:hypothetical protein
MAPILQQEGEFLDQESLPRIDDSSVPIDNLVRRGLVGSSRTLRSAGRDSSFFARLRRSSQPRTSASLAAAEAKSAADTSVVVHSRFNLSVRSGQDRRLLARQRIEIWQNQARGLKVRRHFDEQDQLVAGEWRQG